MKKVLALVLAMVFCLCCAVALADGVAKENIKVGFIFLHDENSTYDLNFLNAAKEACDELGIAYVLKTNIPEGQECFDAAAELVEDEGCNIVFADSFGHESFMIQAAKEYPEVQFLHATGTQAHTVGLDNYHNAFASIYEGRFLAGVAAGLKLNEMIANGEFTAEEAKMGYVGAYPYAEVKSGYTSFFLGARSVCPTVTMEVTFTNSWYDEALEKEGATKLINDGCKLISQHADSMGAPTACEVAGVPDVSYNGSTVAACPNTFIISSRINWAPYFKYMIECVENGEAIVADWTGTIASGSVELSEINEAAAAAGTAEKLEEVKAALEEGTVKVFDIDTFTVNGEKLESYLADVDDLGDFVPETEVISDGYFHESEYRSAPYFDVDIDGISILGA
ncbi:MAG: BMP family ABC transporter substrate-binding protein [Clostridia bacterium]|nr:BMP family ABC transporter substrate-binding protein [Clostridia bacterium]MBR1686700.1 BMP family ABC transporter substrate-binding protein [Clostridia bacterium]MBR2286854.1 BMP family ABC transporter substrate-binding protein [Clostridia bacterium]